MLKFSYKASIFNNTSKLSPNTRIGLIISIFVALGIAIIVLVLSLWYKKRVSKKYLLLNEETEIAKLREKNPNFGIVLDGIKNFYQDSLNDFFTCFVINTIYLNDYEKIYLENNNNYLALSITNLAKKEVSWNGKEDFNLNNELKNQFPDLDFSLIKNVDELNDFADLIVLLDLKNQDLKEVIAKKIPFLKDSGMMIIENNKQEKIKKIQEIARFFDLRYETLKFKNKNVILLAKNNIKEIIEKEN
ncbi:BC85_0335 family putative methyltransferase [Metamycoplasma alkalescens]|uniref:Uncharacterized protein n=2 Tax=Metamycoplasma alkalescens TaxID=45363 RepID=N9UAK7_9BACT|nr:hypothetical protein [Metamycoplasma alkalescens]ENY53721.1 Hypothetical protein MALK_5770 [Metamycoplasma alkalescens 14918]